MRQGADTGTRRGAVRLHPFPGNVATYTRTLNSKAPESDSVHHGRRFIGGRIGTTHGIPWGLPDMVIMGMCNYVLR